MKRWIVSTTQTSAFEHFVGLLERGAREPNGLLRVLTYHRVLPVDAHPAPAPGLFSATPQVFEQQMRFLAAHYRVISMAELCQAVTAEASLSPRSVLITFDDAYCDFEEYAWPILKANRLPVTLFVPTAFPGQPQRRFWWDQLYQAILSDPSRHFLETPLGRLSIVTPAQRLEAFKQLRNYIFTQPHEEAMAWVESFCKWSGFKSSSPEVLGWDALRNLAEAGVTLGAHTRTHPLMHRISSEGAIAEAVRSREDLEREIGSVLPVFAYPGGGFNDAVVDGLRRAGFQLAFTTLRGVNDLRKADRQRLRRINVGQNTSLGIFRAQLTPWMVYLN